MSNYITCERAQEIADERLNTDAWDEAVDEDGSLFGEEGTKCYKALAMATKIINQLDYRGNKTVSTQANAFPRGGDITVPVSIEEACFEIALALLDDVDPQMEAEGITLISQGYANVRSTHDYSTPLPHTLAGVPSITAWRLLAPYLQDPNQLSLLRK